MDHYSIRNFEHGKHNLMRKKNTVREHLSGEMTASLQVELSPALAPSRPSPPGPAQQ
jgi:hypothetical protein